MKGSKVASNGASANAGARKLDGGLFLVRHLLILKEMTQNLDFVNRDTTNRTVDLSAVTGLHLPFSMEHWLNFVL